MTKLLLSFLLLGFASPAFCQETPALGRWENSTAEARIEIFRRGQSIAGKVYWLKNPNNADGTPNLDDKNPDVMLQRRPVMGLEILSNFTDKGNGEYENGAVYNPESGKTYRCKLKVRGDKMEMRGYIGISLLGRTETWTRIR